tara:strand:- start:3637 stop:4062 length:426 start_codon:yes stop_codon:yes gene_type:complete
MPYMNQTTNSTTTDINTAKEIEYLISNLQFWVDEGRNASDDIAEKMLTGTYRVGSMWSLNFDDIALGHRAADVLHIIKSVADQSDVAAKIEAQVERLTEQLMNGWLDPNSSNDLSRGFDATERDAARKLHGVLAGFARRNG